MVSNDVAKKLHAAEVARNTAPDVRCSGKTMRLGEQCPQIVKVGTLCPACGKLAQ